jgi:hypothetical protein
MPFPGYYTQYDIDCLGMATIVILEVIAVITGVAIGLAIT